MSEQYRAGWARGGCLKFGLLAVGGLVAFSLIMSAVQSVGESIGLIPTRTPTPTATTTATMTVTPLPTATATSTPTPLPTATPTVTSTPTETRTPTVTPTPTATLPPTNTPTITLTPLPTHTPTITQTPTKTPIPTSTHTATATPPATPTPTILSAPRVQANNNINVRGGPGTDYPIVGALAAGTAARLTGKNNAGDWWHVVLSDGTVGWIYAPLVTMTGDTSSIGVVAEPSPPPPTQAPARSEPIQVQTRAAEPSGAAFTCIGGCAQPPDPSCAIKGNVNSRGERIYHVPGGQFYDRTDIKPEEGDRWFCTEVEASDAGFRASLR